MPAAIAFATIALMRNHHTCVVLVGALLLAGSLGVAGAQTKEAAQVAPPALLPRPLELTMGKGALSLGSDVFIRYSERDASRAGERSLQAHAQVLAEEIELLTGLRPRVVQESSATTGIGIRLAFEKPKGELAAIEEEERHGYRLEVDAEGVRVAARYSKGVAHGTATLLQCIAAVDGGFRLPFLTVRDEPLHAYRSVMIDVARQPHGIAVLEDVVRLARLYKIRYVQLHLTDDQHFTFPFPPITDTLRANHAYTRDELIRLVAYADARGVTLIPEIDLPGHSSRIKESGYLAKAKTDRDVASLQHFTALHALLDEVMTVFSSSPYLHIGGDESGAGDALLPFLGSMQRYVRSRGRRLIVWEGFHGAPVEVLPAKGPDRVLVAAWESSYNPPWNLLSAGYQLINASWKPLYVVGGDTLVHPGSSGGRMWSPATLAAWRKDLFQHWEPGRPVFDDRGPGDDDRNDGNWLVPPEWRDQVVGAQVSVWEQKESSLIRDLRHRLPVVAERLWSGNGADPTELLARARRVDRQVFAIVQPVEITPESEGKQPIESFYRPMPDDETPVTLHNRSRLEGSIRYSMLPFQGSFTWIDFPEPKDPIKAGRTDSKPFLLKGGGSVRARLFRDDGTPVGGGTWARFLSWPDRVQVTEVDIGRRTPSTVPDLASLSTVVRRYRLPMLRGPIGSSGVVGQMFEARLQVPSDGEYQISLKTQSGRASLYLDLDRDGSWSANELLIENTPTSEEPQTVTVTLGRDAPYSLRIDHASGLPRPVVLAYLEGPGLEKREELSPYLLPID